MALQRSRSLKGPSMKPGPGPGVMPRKRPSVRRVVPAKTDVKTQRTITICRWKSATSKKTAAKAKPAVKEASRSSNENGKDARTNIVKRMRPMGGRRGVRFDITCSYTAKYRRKRSLV